MCASALFWAKVVRVVVGASNAKIMEVGGPPKLSINSAIVLGAGSHPIKVDGPVLEVEAVSVLSQKS